MNFSNEQIACPINNIHDKLYKDFFNDPYEFSLFLKLFFNVNIAPDRIVRHNGSYITDNYKFFQ